MGVLDKFLDIMKLSDDEDYDDDFFDDDYDDDYAEEKPKKNFFRKEKNYDMDEEDEFDDLPAPSSRSSSSNNNKVTPMRQPARRNAPAMEVCVIKPNNMDDSREITETLLANEGSRIDNEEIRF